MFPCLFDLDTGRIKSLPPDFAESCAGNGCRKQGLDLLSLDSISLSFIFFVSLVEERIDFNRALSSRKRIRAGAKRVLRGYTRAFHSSWFMPTRGHKERSPRWGMEEELGTRVAVPSATLFPSFLPSSFPKRLYSPRIIFNYFICARIYFRLIVRTLIPSPIYSLFELVIDFIVDYTAMRV